jgi:hypothetical protein
MLKSSDSTCYPATNPNLFIRTFCAAATVGTLRPAFFAKRALRRGGAMDVCLTRRRNGYKAPTAAGSGLEIAAQNALGLEGNPPACMEPGEDPPDSRDKGWCDLVLRHNGRCGRYSSHSWSTTAFRGERALCYKRLLRKPDHLEDWGVCAGRFAGQLREMEQLGLH